LSLNSLISFFQFLNLHFLFLNALIIAIYGQFSHLLLVLQSAVLSSQPFQSTFQFGYFGTFAYIRGRVCGVRFSTSFGFDHKQLIGLCEFFQLVMLEEGGLGQFYWNGKLLWDDCLWGCRLHGLVTIWFKLLCVYICILQLGSNCLFIYL
jgi:hypothetical protein